MATGVVQNFKKTRAAPSRPLMILHVESTREGTNVQLRSRKFLISRNLAQFATAAEAILTLQQEAPTIPSVLRSPSPMLRRRYQTV
jgi:hypothetical protein